MNKAIIYRLESDEGRGVYSNSNQKGPYCTPWDKVTNGCFEQNIHILPHEDPKLKFMPEFDSEYIFGFSSLEQYHAWVFNPVWRMKFKDNGIKLSVYKVDMRYVRIGDHQAIFIKDHATLIDRVDAFYFK